MNRPSLWRVPQPPSARRVVSRVAPQGGRVHSWSQISEAGTPSTAPAAPGRRRIPVTVSPTGATVCGPVSAPATFRPLSPSHTRSTHPSGITRCGLCEPVVVPQARDDGLDPWVTRTRGTTRPSDNGSPHRISTTSPHLPTSSGRSVRLMSKPTTYYFLAIGAAVATPLSLVLAIFFLEPSVTVVATTGSTSQSSPFSSSAPSSPGSAPAACRWPSLRQQQPRSWSPWSPCSQGSPRTPRSSTSWSSTRCTSHCSACLRGSSDVRPRLTAAVAVMSRA